MLNNDAETHSFDWKCVGGVAGGWSPGVLLTADFGLCEGDSEILELCIEEEEEATAGYVMHLRRLS